MKSYTACHLQCSSRTRLTLMHIHRQACRAPAACSVRVVARATADARAVAAAAAGTAGAVTAGAVAAAAAAAAPHRPARAPSVAAAHACHASGSARQSTHHVAYLQSKQQGIQGAAEE